MDTILQLVLNGLAVGCIYGLVALGFVLIYKATELVNFAQGDLLMLGAFTCYMFVVWYGVGYWAALALAIARDGALFVSTGFHVRRLFRVSPEGTVKTIASELGDPNGVAVDPDGHIYVAETALHRVIRIAPK